MRFIMGWTILAGILALFTSCSMPTTGPSSRTLVTTRPEQRAPTVHQRQPGAIRDKTAHAAEFDSSAGKTVPAQTQPDDAPWNKVHPGMTLDEASNAMSGPGVQMSDDLAGTTVYAWSIPIDPNFSPDGRFNVRPLLTNLTVTVRNGRITSCHWD